MVVMLDGSLSSQRRSTIDSRYIATAGAYVYDRTRVNGYTYRFGKIYAPTYNDEGRFVYSYRPLCSFDEYVHNIGVHPLIDPSWCVMLQAVDMGALIRSLKSESHYAMPTLVRDRSLCNQKN